jgi:hypothetical protein
MGVFDDLNTLISNANSSLKSLNDAIALIQSPEVTPTPTPALDAAAKSGVRAKLSSLGGNRLGTNGELENPEGVFDHLMKDMSMTKDAVNVVKSELASVKGNLASNTNRINQFSGIIAGLESKIGRVLGSVNHATDVANRALDVANKALGMAGSGTYRPADHNKP